MHADTQQLLALSDGEPVAESADRHVRSCEHCQRELERLQRLRARLRALPPVAAPPPSPRVLAARSPALTSRRSLWISVAASVALAALTAIYVAPRDATAPAVREPVAAAPTNPDSLPVRSAALEREWRSLRRHVGAVRRVGYETGTARIKAQILALDARNFIAPVGTTGMPADNYWSQRVRLLDSLVDIERAELLTNGDGDYRIVRTGAPVSPVNQ